MSGFPEYIQTAHRRLNGFESNLLERWEREDSFIARHEAALRVALLAALLALPFGADGRVSRAAEEFRRARRRTSSAIALFENVLLDHFGGNVEPADVLAGVGTTWTGVRARAAAGRQEYVVRAYGVAGDLLRDLEHAARRALTNDLGRGDVPPKDSGDGPPPKPNVPPAGPAGGGAAATPRMLAPDWIDYYNYLRSLDLEPPMNPDTFWQWVEENIDEIRARAKKLLDERDQQPEDSLLPEEIENGISNPKANIRYETRRWREILNSIPHKRPTRSEIIELVNGTRDRRDVRGAEDRAGGFAINRNNMRLSIDAHVRGMVRSEVVRFSEARTIRHFLLEAPRSRLADVSPHGAIAAHLHQLRTLEEWRSIFAAVAADKRTDASFEAMGLHHGDFTMPIPVPIHLVAAAREYSKEARAALERRLRRAA